MSTTVLGKKEAHDLTRRIRENTQHNARLLREAWAGKVWVPLGYETFNSWLEATVGVTRQRAYQLIAIVTMTESLQAAIPLPQDFTLTDVQTRSIVSFGANGFIANLREHVQASGSREENVDVVLQALAALRNHGSTAAKAQRTTSPVNLGPTVGMSAAERSPNTFVQVADAIHAHTHTITQVKNVCHETLYELQLATSALRARLTELQSVMEVAV